MAFLRLPPPKGETQRCTCIELKVEVLHCRRSYPGSAAAACTKPPQQVIKAGGEWQTASETSLEERETSMTVKSAPAKGRRGGGARAGLGQGIGGASGGQVVKEGTPELKKVRPDITQVVKKKTRGGIVGARSKTTPKTGKPVPLTSEFQVRDLLLYKGGGYQHWPVQVSLCMTTSLTWYTVEPARLAPSLSRAYRMFFPSTRRISSN